MHRTASLGYGNEEPTAQAQWLLRYSSLSFALNASLGSGYSGHRYQGTEYLNRQYNLTVDIPNAQGAMDTTGLQSGLESFSPAFSPTPSTASVVTPRSTASYKPYGGLDPVIYTGASPSDLSGFNLQYGDPSQHHSMTPLHPPRAFGCK
ncbi:hypothetical protein MPER_06384 [Moniliophthora perniciosa FA553]|nr:hypothetical protein MPER_06384 [Moniliophthora perniciosa FA553]